MHDCACDYYVTYRQRITGCSCQPFEILIFSSRNLSRLSLFPLAKTVSKSFAWFRGSKRRNKRRQRHCSILFIYIYICIYLNLYDCYLINNKKNIHNINKDNCQQSASVCSITYIGLAGWQVCERGGNRSSV